jgi:hypothetical protein
MVVKENEDEDQQSKATFKKCRMLHNQATKAGYSMRKKIVDIDVCHSFHDLE